MDLDELSFPVLFITKDFKVADMARRPDDLLICGKGALHNGFFNNLLLVDTGGKAYRVKNAKKLHGVGLFWGYRLFHTQRIRVELQIEEEPQAMPLDEVKTYIFTSFRTWHGWQSRGDFEELKQQIKNAKSISEIMELLSES